jgi:phosphoribosylanthranilate isomerase
VDVASGVESSDPRRKDPERVKAFVLAAKQSLP